MRCPACGHADHKVVDSRTAQDGDSIRRRRECESCGFRFTTYERVEESLPMIVKRDGRREPYSRDKLLTGLRIACRKRPIGTDQIEELVHSVERSLMSSAQKEVDSNVLGSEIMRALAQLDQVAYIRFASVYYSFEDLESFSRIVDTIREGAEAVPSSNDADASESA
ncbi:MAG: transcriptional repressor NrdR [Myxococcales bacterium]|nr:transcriptional repressor NrdR [Myxococcales bacterium]